MSRISSHARSKLNQLAVLDAQTSRVFLRDENVVAGSTGQRIDRSLQHGIELLATSRGEVKHSLGCAAVFGNDRGEIRLAARRCEFAGGEKRASTPLEVVA